MTSPATVTFQADLDNSRLSRSLGQTRTMLSRWGRRVTQIFTGVGLVILARKFYNVAEAIRTAYKDQIAAEAKLASVSAATGNAAGYSAEQFQKLANNMQDLQGISDNVALDMFAIIATFKNIRGQEFEQAAKLAADMSEVLGQDLKSSAIQVAKALNDPIAGLTALSRVGVSFTEQQKTMIRTAMATGDILTAQGVIINELTTEFGGAAEEQHEMTGRMAALHNRLGDAAEVISGALLPIFSKLADFFQYMVVIVESFAEALDANKDVIEQWAIAAADNVKFFAIAFASSTVYAVTFLEQGLRKSVAVAMWWNASLVAAAVTVGNVLMHILTEVIPPALKFLVESMVANVVNMINAFKYLKNNIHAIGSDIVAFIFHMLSGGSAEDFRWKSLEKGFELSFAELPKIAKREVGVIENELAHLVDDLSQNAADIDPFGAAEKAAQNTTETMLDFANFAANKSKDPRQSPDVQTEPFKVDPVKEKEKKKKKEKDDEQMKGSMEGVTATFDRIFQAAAGRKKDPMEEIAATLNTLAETLVETPTQIANFIVEAGTQANDALMELKKIATGVTALEQLTGITAKDAQEQGAELLGTIQSKLNLGVK